MDTGLTLKPAAGTTPIGDGRPTPAVRNAVATELALSQAVTAATETAPGPPAGPSRLPEAALDPQGREVLYRAADVRARRAARQSPEKALLQRRQQAYTRVALDEESGDQTVEVTI